MCQHTHNNMLTGSSDLVSKCLGETKPATFPSIDFKSFVTLTKCPNLYAILKNIAFSSHRKKTEKIKLASRLSLAGQQEQPCSKSVAFISGIS